jgi:hypothetical protein
MNGWNIKRWKGLVRDRHIKTWQLFLLLVIFILLSGFFLRQNNLTMVRLRSEVVVADESGQGVTEAIEALNQHVFSHMNTQIVRPVELVKTYDRQARAIIEATVPAPNRSLYEEAAAVCAGRGSLFSDVRNQCVIDYINTNNTGFGELPKINLPDKNRFIYSFASPLWTPDLAGVSVLISLVLAAWLLLRLFEKLAVSLVIRHRQKRGF